MLLIEACKESISERFIRQISDKYDDGIVRVSFRTLDGNRGCAKWMLHELFYHYAHVKKYIKRIETVIMGYFSSLGKDSKVR